VKKIEEYFKHAAECRDMARTASPAHREQLEQMAETWEQLANARKHQMEKIVVDQDAAPKDSEGLVIEFEIPSQNEKGPKRKL
jgi:hypothetical protein